MLGQQVHVSGRVSDSEASSGDSSTSSDDDDDDGGSDGSDGQESHAAVQAKLRLWNIGGSGGGDRRRR